MLDDETRENGRRKITLHSKFVGSTHWQWIGINYLAFIRTSRQLLFISDLSRATRPTLSQRIPNATSTFTSDQQIQRRISLSSTDSCRCYETPGSVLIEQVMCIKVYKRELVKHVMLLAVRQLSVNNNKHVCIYILIAFVLKPYLLQQFSNRLEWGLPTVEAHIWSSHHTTTKMSVISENRICTSDFAGAQLTASLSVELAHIVTSIFVSNLFVNDFLNSTWLKATEVKLPFLFFQVLKRQNCLAVRL